MTLHSAKGGSGERGLDDDSRLAGMDGTTPQNGTDRERGRVGWPLNESELWLMHLEKMSLPFRYQ